MFALSFLSGPFSFLAELLDWRSLLQTALAVLPALVLHEVAHAYAAWRLGDPTAKMMGRLTLNPLRHLDPMGTVLLFVAHIGWAKPVPVNPYYFKNKRRDDLIVSLAGITANLVMCLFGCVIVYAALFYLIATTGRISGGSLPFLMDGVNYRVDPAFLLKNAFALEEYFVAPQAGAVWGFLYGTVCSFVTINLGLAIFNLLPIPPLDGYHVVNDLILKKPLFARREVAQICQMGLLVLSFTGYLGKGMSYVIRGALSGAGNAAVWIGRLIGLIQGG